jgi:hypothetical protein
MLLPTMAILDNLAKGVKDFFVEEGHAAPAATAAARPLPAAPALALPTWHPARRSPSNATSTTLPSSWPATGATSTPLPKW